MELSLPQAEEYKARAMALSHQPETLILRLSLQPFRVDLGRTHLS